MKMIEMSSEDFEIFRELSVTEFASKLNIDFGFTHKQCLKEANTDFERLLPKGLQTETHRCYFLKNENNEKLGYLWIQIREKFGRKRVFINEILVLKDFRGQGYGRFMLKWLEKKTGDLGFSEIALHSRADNNSAIKLYKSMGYELTNFLMKKNITQSV